MDRQVGFDEFLLVSTVEVDPLPGVSVPEHVEGESLVAEPQIEGIGDRGIGAPVDCVEVRRIDQSVPVEVQELVGSGIHVGPVRERRGISVYLVDGIVVAVVDGGHTVALGHICLSGNLLIVRGVRRVVVGEDPVFVDSQHGSEFVIELPGGGLPPLQLKVDAVLFHPSVVYVLVGDSDEGGHVLRGHQHVEAVLVIEVDVESQGVLEPAHFDAEVPLVGGFPAGCDVGGLHLDDVSVALYVAGVVEPVVGAVVASDGTVGVAHLHGAPPRQGLLPELFLGDIVADREGGEDAVTV